MTNRRRFLKYVLGLAGLATGVPIAVKASGGDGSSPNDDEVMCAAEDCGTPIAPGDATPTAPEWEPPVAVDPEDEWWATITELPNTGTGSSLMGGERTYITGDVELFPDVDCDYDGNCDFLGYSAFVDGCLRFYSPDMELNGIACL